MLVLACTESLAPASPSTDAVSRGVVTTTKPTTRVAAEATPFSGDSPALMPDVETADQILTTPAPTLPPQPDPASPPILRIDDDTSVLPALQGGCGWLAYRDAILTSDQCGPTDFDQALEAVPVDVRGGAIVSVLPAEGWLIGPDASLGVDWFVRVAATQGLKGNEQWPTGFPDGTGRTLVDAMKPVGVARVQAPVAAGDYLLQLDAPFSRDAWSNMQGTWYWHIRVR